MPASKNTKKTNRKYGAGWGSQNHELEMPSGEMCLVRRPGVQGLIAAGIMEQGDVLTGMVQQQTLRKAQGKPEMKAEEVLNDKGHFEAIIEAVDKIAAYVVVEPKLWEPFELELSASGEPIWEGERPKFKLVDGKRVTLRYDQRDPEKVYTDYVDLEDRMFIMNFVVGGAKDLATFRAKSEEALGSVSDGEAAPDAAE
jgi:hypothetical protein